MMQLQTAQRKRAKIKMAIQSPSGGGKSFSSLLIAKGLTNGDFSKVAVIDSENGSSNLYAHLGEYNVLPISPPYTPEKYIEAITVCENAGMEVIILDSISHAWDELLDFHSKLAGNSFTNWNKVTPRQKAFVDKILHCNAHIIATMRTKQDYVRQQNDNKFKVEKVGLKSVQRDGMDYEFTLVFDIDINHFASSSKDRTGLFSNVPDFKISSETGKKILDWCNSGADNTLEEARAKIKKCEDMGELKQVYNAYIEWKDQLMDDFTKQKREILSTPELTNPENFSLNGSK
ncbi:MAG: AAA family ATPase [Chitinophagales bacterium]